MYFTYILYMYCLCSSLKTVVSHNLKKKEIIMRGQIMFFVSYTSYSFFYQIFFISLVSRVNQIQERELSLIKYDRNSYLTIH